MKRICYLLVWLLTGFSVAANQNSQPEIFLLSRAGTSFPVADESYAQHLNKGILPAAAPKEMESGEISSAHTSLLICSAKR